MAEYVKSSQALKEAVEKLVILVVLHLPATHLCDKLFPAAERRRILQKHRPPCFPL